MSNADLPDHLIKRVDKAIKAFETSPRDTALRFNMAEEMIKQYETDLREGVVKLLKHPDPEIREISLYILGEVGGLEQIDPILDVLNDINEDVRINAIHALSSIIAPRSPTQKAKIAIEAVIEMLKDSSVEVRMTAVSAFHIFNGLHWFDRERLIPLLEQVYQYDKGVSKENGTIRDFAASIIKHLKLQNNQMKPVTLIDPSTVEINNAIKGFERLPPDSVLRYSLADAVIDKYGTAVIEEIIPLLKHQNCEVRKISLYILGAVGGPEQVEPVLDKLNDADENVRKNAIETLVLITGKNPTQNAKTVIDAIIEMLKDSSVEVRMEAVAAFQKFNQLAWFEDERLIPLLEQVYQYDKGVSEENGTIRDLAASTIEELKLQNSQKKALQ